MRNIEVGEKQNSSMSTEDHDEILDSMGISQV